MKVLVVGGGGREHAIVWKLAQSPKKPKLYCAPGNGGIASLAECVPIRATDVDGIVRFAKEEKIDLTVVAPDDPLMLGMVDALEKEGLRAFGPRKDAALIEGSKVFSKRLMKKYGIPTADCEVFDDPQKALDYVRTKGAPIVVKAEGLALGKGVVVAQTVAEAEQAIEEIMLDKKFGDAGNRILVEECLSGPEVSVLAFTDGKTVRPMVSAQDHKRAFDRDEGPNTGGMGAFSPSRNYTPEVAAECMEKIFLPTVRAMNAEGRAFKGVLYFGLMLTDDGAKVIEYNARFGDPETQAVLPRLKSDLLAIFESVVDGTLEQAEIEWTDDAAVCIVMASGGYPKSYQTGYPIEGIDAAESLGDVTVFHAGTKLENGRIVTGGGRVLGVAAVRGSLDDAIRHAYQATEKIRFQNAHYRHDIGVKKN